MNLNPLFTSRIAALNDVPKLQELLELSVRKLSVDYYTEQQIDASLKYIFGIDTQLIKDKTYFIVEKENVLVGCGGWSKRNTLYGGDQYKEIEDPLLDPSKDAARIRAFFVHPDYARQGIGKFIMETCEQEAINNGFRKFELGATLPGVPLYKTMGYAEVKYLEERMPNKEVLPLIKMEKIIS